MEVGNILGSKRIFDVLGAELMDKCKDLRNKEQIVMARPRVQSNSNTACCGMFPVCCGQDQPNLLQGRKPGEPVDGRPKLLMYVGMRGQALCFLGDARCALGDVRCLIRHLGT